MKKIGAFAFQPLLRPFSSGSEHDPDAIAWELYAL